MNTTTQEANRKQARTNLTEGFQEHTSLAESLVTPMVDAIERYALTNNDSGVPMYYPDDQASFQVWIKANPPRSTTSNDEFEDKWWTLGVKSRLEAVEGGETNLQKMWPYIQSAVKQFRYVPPSYAEYANGLAQIKSLKRGEEMYRTALITTVTTINELLNEEAEKQDWCDDYESRLERGNGVIATNVRNRLGAFSGASEAQIGQVLRDIPDLEGRSYTWTGQATREVTIRVTVVVSDIEASDESEARSIAESAIDQEDIDEQYIISALRYGTASIENVEECDSSDVEVEKD